MPPPAVLSFLFRVLHRSVHYLILRVRRRCLLIARRFIASAGTYANLVKQAKSKQKIIDKMEADGLIEKIETPRPLNFRFEDVQKLPPPILAIDSIAFSYSGLPKDYLYKNLSFGIEYVSPAPSPSAV